MDIALDHYRLLGAGGLRVSPLCLGTMTFGTEWGWGAPPEECREMVRLYLELGGNFIDTANKYTEGASEAIVGSLIAERRDYVVLSTKYSLSTRAGDPNAGGNHRKNMVQALEGSLRRLKTDRIDLYWVHAWDGITPIEEVMRGLDDLVRAGKVLYVGISDTPAWKVAQANTLAQLRGWSAFVALQCEYNLIERTPERDLLPMAHDLRLGVMPWSPLASGILTGKYASDAKAENGERKRAAMVEGRLTPRVDKILASLRAVANEIGRPLAQVALRWVAERPGVDSVLLGARTVSQLADNLACTEVRLAREQLAVLDEASRIELGFPHAFLQSEGVRNLLFGGARVAPPH